MNGFERRREQSKEDIRRAAWELINKFGINKVSISDIARKAGVSQVTIYNHFGSKRNLIRELLQMITDEELERIRIMVQADEPYQEKLENLLRLISGVAEKFSLNSNSREIYRDPELLQIHTSAFDKLADFYTELIKEGRKKGHIGSEITNEAIRAYFTIMSRGLEASPEFHARLHNNPKLMQGYLTLMLYGLGGRNQ